MDSSTSHDQSITTPTAAAASSGSNHPQHTSSVQLYTQMPVVRIPLPPSAFVTNPTQTNELLSKPLASQSQPLQQQQQQQVPPPAIDLANIKKKTYNIPAPQVMAAAGVDGNASIYKDLGLEGDFHPPSAYIRHRASGKLADSEVEYELTFDDQEWLRQHTKYNPKGIQPVSPDTLEQLLNLFEQHSGFGPLVTPTEIEAIAKEKLGIIRSGTNKILEDVHTYWVSKRSKLRKPLVRKYWPITSSDDTNPNLTFRPREKERYRLRRKRGNDMESYEKLTRLHSDFMLVRDILELVKRREKLSWMSAKLQEDKFEKRRQELLNPSNKGINNNSKTSNKRAIDDNENIVSKMQSEIPSLLDMHGKQYALRYLPPPSFPSISGPANTFISPVIEALIESVNDNIAPSSSLPLSKEETAELQKQSSSSSTTANANQKKKKKQSSDGNNADDYVYRGDKSSNNPSSSSMQRSAISASSSATATGGAAISTTPVSSITRVSTPESASVPTPQVQIIIKPPDPNAEPPLPLFLLENRKRLPEYFTFNDPNSKELFHPGIPDVAYRRRIGRGGRVVIDRLHVPPVVKTPHTRRRNPFQDHYEIHCSRKLPIKPQQDENAISATTKYHSIETIMEHMEKNHSNHLHLPIRTKQKLKTLMDQDDDEDIYVQTMESSLLTGDPIEEQLRTSKFRLSVSHRN